MGSLTERVLGVFTAWCQYIAVSRCVSGPISEELPVLFRHTLGIDLVLGAASHPAQALQDILAAVGRVTGCSQRSGVTEEAASLAVAQCDRAAATCVCEDAGDAIQALAPPPTNPEA